ncbi:MAG: Gfo/Idh/MocA family oxidoreductase [bacterium]|nr:Gfo/Idh/MocA family oxidoreductase [bacterium]
MLRVGMIGAGGFATKHVNALAELSDRARLVQLARRDPSVPCAAAPDIPVTSLDDLIESPDVDAVCVCSPNHLHPEHVERVLGAGKHVFCEKPLALTVADADALIARAEQAGRVLMVGHLTRHASLYATVARVLETGDFGAIRTVYSGRLQGATKASWRMDPIQGGGAAFDLLIHDFDVLNWYLGPPESIVACGRRHAMGAHASMTVTLQYADGATATAEGGFVLPPGSAFRALLRVVAEKAYLEVDTLEPDSPIRIHRDGELEIVTPSSPGPGFDGIPGEWCEFLDAIDGKAPVHLTPANARLAVLCAESAVRSAEQGGAPVHLTI